MTTASNVRVSEPVQGSGSGIATDEAQTIGPLLRAWRTRRRCSQLEVSVDAEISTRHLSFIETGRSRPSRDMVLLLADQLDVPLRDRNHLLLAAGYAPAYGERSLDDSEMDPVREALRTILTAYRPFPALAVDRGWHMVDSNDAVGPLLAGVAEHLLRPPVNVLRLSLHPDGLSGRIMNLAEWRGNILDRLAREVSVTGSGELAALREELVGYPGGYEHASPQGRIAVPLRLRSNVGELEFISTVTTFGTAVDVALAELSIEAFLPANAWTAAALNDGGATGNS